MTSVCRHPRGLRPVTRHLDNGWLKVDARKVLCYGGGGLWVFFSYKFCVVSSVSFLGVRVVVVLRVLWG